MSVAFRRESDDEHLEPKFERPIPPGPNLVTPRGLGLLADEAAAAERRLADADPAARAAIARDLRYWRARLATARVAPPPPEGEAGIGSRVRYRLAGAEHEVEIVGTDEAEPESGRIGFISPLARALIGGGEGDVLPFGTSADGLEIIAVVDPEA